MYLAHVETEDSRDKLLSCYTSREWRKLLSALQKVRKKLLPVFQSVDDPFAPEETVMRITPKQIDKIKELRGQKKTYKAIAEEVGLHHVTVGKICRAAKRAVCASDVPDA